jgi:twitching motility protein PilT
MHGPAPGSRVDALLEILWQARGTDLLLTAGVPPQIRVHGNLCPAPGQEVLGVADIERLLAEMLLPEQQVARRAVHEYDFAFGWREHARVRGNAFGQRGAPAVALRMIPKAVPTMDELRLPRIVYEFAARHHGLVLVTGPTGSGKSTTLAAVINQINTDRACHIVTIEDPIEYVHEHRRSAVDQREVGTDTASFADALRSVLREDPDVVLVGEMRDIESIRFALTIAETGHLVFATLHTNDTTQALARIVDSFPAEQQAQIRVQLAAALTGIVYQRLLPRQGGGLVAGYEVLVANSAVRNLIKEGKTHQLRNSLVTGQRDSMITFEQSLSALVQSGEVSYQDAVVRSLYPKDIADIVRPRVGTPA